MANLFLPQLITWFRLDEHVKRLKGRVDILETNPTGVIEITGTFVNNTDPSYPIIVAYNATATDDGLMDNNDYKKLNNLGNYIDDATASSNGVPIGGFYHTAGALKINLGII